MADTQNGQQAAMPTANEPVQGTEVEETQVSNQEQVGLPEESSERTKQQFEKLKEDLRREREEKEYYRGVASSFSVTPNQTPEAKETSFIDPDTGLIKEQVLTEAQKAAIEARDTAKRTEQTVQDYMQEQENKSTFQKFPSLNPDSKEFDKEFHVLTRQIALDSMVNPQDYSNKQLSFIEAAERAHSRLGKTIDSGKKEAVNEAVEAISQKESASLSVGAQSSRSQQAADDLETLQYRSRRGDENALAERIARYRKDQS